MWVIELILAFAVGVCCGILWAFWIVALDDCPRSEEVEETEAWGLMRAEYDKAAERY